MRSRISILAILLFLAGVAVLLSSLQAMPSYMGFTTAPKSLGESIRAGIAPIPALSTSTRDKLAASHGFQALVSYTDRGFEPSDITIKKGETVRFTNNSSRRMWIAAAGEQLYPGVQNGCGSSALDSCDPIGEQDFWEFTFDAPGSWKVTNNLNKSAAITVVVSR